MSSITPSTYASTVGENQFAVWFINHLGLTVKDFGRFRDAALYREKNKEGEYIVRPDGKGVYVIRVLTRNAGAMKTYEPINKKLEKHPLFIRQELELTDERQTYLYFFFAMPESMIDEIKANQVDLDTAFAAGDTFLVDNRNLRTKISDARIQQNKPKEG